MNNITASSSKSPSSKGSAKARNSAARLLAVQAVYQMTGNDQKADSVIREFLEHRAGMEIDGDSMVSPDKEHFSAVVQGVFDNYEQLKEMIALNRKKPAKAPEPIKESEKSEEETGESEETKPVVKKIEPLLHSIFLCGAFELMDLQAIDSPIIISDYLHVTHAFYDEGEAKLVNAVLDSLRKTVRD